MSKFDFRSELCRTISMLAASADEQIEYLKGYRVLPGIDELALEFDDVYVMVPQLVEQGLITTEQCEAVDSLSDKLKVMSGMQNAHLWTPDALISSPEWADIRRLASTAKRLLQCRSD